MYVLCHWSSICIMYLIVCNICVYIYTMYHKIGEYFVYNMLGVCNIQLFQPDVIMRGPVPKCVDNNGRVLTAAKWVVLHRPLWRHSFLRTFFSCHITTIRNLCYSAFLRFWSKFSEMWLWKSPAKNNKSDQHTIPIGWFFGIYTVKTLI